MAKVLVVDDERNVRASVAIALRREGHDVETAMSGEEALGIARDVDPDVVLTDLRLSGMDGLELIRGLRRQSPGIGVVVMTAFGSIESAVEAMQAGAGDYLRKPFEAGELAAVVERALRTHPDAAAGPPAEPRAESRTPFDGIIGRSPALRELLGLVSKVAETDSTVLITGETGTGKELIGRAIHRASRRRDRVFSAVNSAAFPETLLESELFGHRRGSFTGASSNKKGLFESAHQGTVFLDEVAEMPLSMQAKLLRFLQTGEIRPVGGESTRLVDVRLVTATNKSLEEEVAAGRFREDLYYRLNVIPIHVPALRERIEDVPLLAEYFLRRFARRLDKAVDGIAPDALEILTAYPWPGNVRELENCIERGAALCRGPRIGPEDLPTRLCEQPEPSRVEPMQSLQKMERAHILRTLEQVGWNRKRAAEVLQISTTTLWRRLKEFGIEGSRAHGEGFPAASPRSF